MADELKPEERARIKIDEQLADAGWHIADRGGVTYEHNAIALVEGLLEGNKEADYLLFVDGKVVGVLEAKRSDIDLESAAGGQAANYAHRSPVTHLKNAKNVPVYIGTGIHDGYKGSVPVCHAMWGFNMLADEKDRIPDDVIREIVETQAVPYAWLFDGSDPDYVQRIHMRTTSGNVRFTLFEGAHDILPSQGLNWLSNQRKGATAKWDVAPLSPEWTKERWGLAK